MGIDTCLYPILIPLPGTDAFRYLVLIPSLGIDTFRYLIAIPILGNDTFFDTKVSIPDITSVGVGVCEGGGNYQLYVSRFHAHCLFEKLGF